MPPDVNFKAKMHQDRFRLGWFPSQTPLGRLQRSPVPLAGLKGGNNQFCTSKGRGGDMGREEKGRKGMGMQGSGREGEGGGK